MSDPEKRKKYDQYGANWKQNDQFEEAKRKHEQTNAHSSRNPFGGNGEHFSFSGDEDASDFFTSMFGNQGRGRQTRFKGQDYRATVQVNLSAAYNTHKQTFEVDGKNIRITVPAGIQNGQEIKIAGYGAQGVNGGPNGDLFITFNIHNDTAFLRKGDDLYSEVSLDLYKAVLGGEETVDTMNGKVLLKVAPETQSGAKVRLKGKGFPVYKKEGMFGDLYITYQVKVPQNLNEKEKELFKELAKERK